MAITPRTIFSTPASATVATVALLAFSAVGTLAYQVANRTASQTQAPSTFAHASSNCDSVREVIGSNTTQWSENAWILMASCYERNNDSRSAAQVALRGVSFYPQSETLYNIAGYHEIVQGEYHRAIDTLQTGLRHVERPTNGVMANNLAWASLWVPNSTSPAQARALYQSSLRFDQNSCETLHTGLWVEYAIAAQHRSGIEQAQALRNFQNLRTRYNHCQSRVEDGQWKSMVEVMGAAVLFENIDSILASRPAYGSQTDGAQAVQRVTEKLRKDYGGISVKALCAEAMPLEGTRAGCAQSVTNAVHNLQRAQMKSERHSEKRRGACQGRRMRQNVEQTTIRF